MLWRFLLFVKISSRLYKILSTKLLILAYYYLKIIVSTQIFIAIRENKENSDNTKMSSHKRNLHKSSYQRFGLEDKFSTISETHAMLSQISLKDEYRHIVYPRRNLLTMQLFSTEYKKDYEEKDLKLRDVLVDPIAICQMDYRSIMKSDYQSPYPIKPKLPLLPLSPEPLFLNRHTIGYSFQDLENRCGYYTFLDDGMDLHQRIANLKRKRDKLSEILIDNRQ